MIQSLNQINKSLLTLNRQLSSKQTTPQAIKKCIFNLVEEVKFLDEKQRYHYYMLIAEIYATRFQNIPEAISQLQQFSKSLHSQISMNCQLRMAFFRYFRMQYLEAFKHLDLALGQVEEQLKLIDNANFFFHRVFNKPHLLSQTQNLNFEAGFVLSLIYQKENQLIPALKQIQTFLQHAHDPFVKFQIYKRLLELYESMKQQGVSTISISKKAIETHREDLTTLQLKHPLFQENYHLKCKFLNRVLDFSKVPPSPNQEKLQKKMLDLKLLAYFKLKKTCKQAPSRDIKDALQHTAKLIKTSPSNQHLEHLLNYDFVKQDYESFKALYKPAARLRHFYNSKFFEALCEYSSYEGGNRLEMDREEQDFFDERRQKTVVDKSVFSKKTKPQYESQYQAEYDAPLTSTKRSNIEQPQLFSFKSNLKTSSPIATSKTPTSRFVNLPKQSIPIKQTESQLLNIDDFEGSNMYKFNATSSGHEERYFYILPQKIYDKPKLFYTLNKKTKSASDSYYPLKGLKKILTGKLTDTLQKKQAQKYPDSQCFALIFEDGKDRSFYVPNQEDLQKWVLLLQTKVLYTDSNIDKMTKTMGFKPEESKKNMSRSSPPKKSKVKLNI